ncbi:methylornithine synthase PylB [Sporomusa acidovorans]|uniref:Biotin synthase n=1 Tax=Sporomusa acidovorans (strain ATCC 49682 / DSM 3132 / Mol) TaxID=1123286 RepID=A0ABZ3J637_SPOA4|nr:methylornithine synthase PylB [Sporomusa acidovorans]OZC18525.1 2-iminoacetate synthase [Sporomusa acidovorans DSM 3132]SDE37248.1 pyrrolysine biosynthesis protein PylB [Sporomusa acidovorans]
MIVQQPSTLDRILEKAFKEELLGRDELLHLLKISEKNELSRVFEMARLLRTRYFENKIFLYGFIYFSTYCRNECNFCLYRKSNHSLHRYHKNHGEIMEIAYRLVKSGIHLLDLTMGEDPRYYDNKSGFDSLIRTVQAIKEGSEMPIMISAGVVPKDVLRELKKAGAEWYACYQETHNPHLYSRLRVGQSFYERMKRKKEAKDMGFLIEEGLLTGVGEKDGDVVDSLQAMRRLEADQVRVMSFVPQKGTPMQNVPSIPRTRERLILAIMRLVFPDRLIPASLDVDGINGLADRLDAGANVVTSIIPPNSGLAGVSNQELDIDDANRTVERILPILEGLGLIRASTTEYMEWILARLTKVMPSYRQIQEAKKEYTDWVVLHH